MRKDPTEFRKRFAAWKNGEQPYKGGRPSAISEVDKSDADFAERLRSNWRQETWDWEGSGKAVTHKIGSADNIVYPNVQTTKGGGLIDFTNPIWKGVVDPLNRAIINKDYVPMKTEQDAIWFGPNYKEYYPKFKDGKLPGYKDGDKPITVGEYNVYPSAIGASELNVTTPEVVVTGKDRRPLYQRYDAERSVYNPNDVISGFNALTLGGMNNLSPTQWARRFYDAPKLFSGDMSFSDYTSRWLNGNEGIVSANFEKTHPYVSMAINGGADILTGAAMNKLQQLNKLSRLQKMYTSVPKTVDKVTGEVMPDLFRKGYSGTVWTSNNPDYGYYLTNGGETFDVYFDPKKLNLLDTPHAPAGTYFVWNRLPLKGRGGKIQVNPKAEVDDTAFMYNTKNDALANTDKFGILQKSHGALHPLIEPRLMNKNTLGLKEGLKTDHVVRYSKMLNRDGAKFHNVYDGGAEDLRGFVYDTPLEEVVLNPRAEYFWTEHNAGRLGLLNQMSYKNLIPYTSTGTLSNLTHTRNELRNK